MASDGTIKITTELDSLKAQQAMSKFEKISKKGLTGIKVATAAIATTLAATSVYVVKTGSEFESAFAGVKKTVDATDEELQQLRSDIRGLTKDIPQTAAAIAEVTEAAGQLGIKNAYLMDFTETMSNMGVATNMSATEAATSLARLANITQMQQDKFGNLGSTVVALGNKLATTESEITEMGLRLAGAGKQVGMTEAQILGLAGALSSVGIEADAGGSAMSTVMSKIQLAVEQGGESLEQFAEVAEMSADEFKEAFQTDAAGAIVAFVTGLGKMDSKGQSAIKTLADMEITEIRQRDALLRLSGAGDILTNSLGIATQAWNENNALTKEAEQRYETLDSRFQIFKNSVADFAITVYDGVQEPLKNTVNESIGYVERLHGAFSDGGLKGTVKEVGQIFDEVTDEIASTSDAAYAIIKPLKQLVNIGADLGGDVLPLVADGLELVTKNMDVAIPLAVGLGTAYKGLQAGRLAAEGTNLLGKAIKSGSSWWKTATLQLSRYAEQMEAAKYTGRMHNIQLTSGQAVLGAFTGKINLATAGTTLFTNAQKSLTAVIAANPIGSAIVGLTAFIALSKAAEAVATRQTEAERKHSQELKEATKAAKENLEVAKERRESFEELVQSQNEQAACDIAQMDRLKQLNNELNTIVDANGNIKAGEEDRAAFITSQLSNALGIEIAMTGNQIANYQDLQSQIQNLIQQKRIDAIMTAQQAKYEEAVNNQMKAAAEASEAYTAMKEAENAVVAENAELKSLQAEQDQAAADGNKAQVKILGEKIKRQQEDADAAKENYETHKKAYEESTKTLAQYANEIDQYTALAEAAASGNADAIEKAITQITAGIKTASNATDEELQEQVIAVANMEKLIRQEVEKGTPGFTQSMIEQASQSTTAALEEFAKVAPQTAEEFEKVPVEAVAALIAGDFEGKLSAEASGAVDGMLDTIRNMDSDTREATLALIDPMLTETQKSQLRMKINGEGAGTNFAAGVNSKKQESYNAGASNVQSANEGAKSVSGYSAGSDFGSGFVKGIKSWAGSAANAAASVAQSAYEQLRKTLDERSPSRKTKKSGKNFDLGLGLGIEENEDAVTGPAEHLTESALEALDMEKFKEKVKGMNIPDIMTTVYDSVGATQDRVARNAVANIEAKENLAWKRDDSTINAKLSDEDIKKLASEFASIASKEMANGLVGVKMKWREREMGRFIREEQQ